MLINYCKTAVRFLLRNRAFSLTNVVGLSLGILCCLYILLYVRNQYSYDRQHYHAEDVYRITTAIRFTAASNAEDAHEMSTCSPPIAPAMKKDFPEVEQFTRVVPTLGASEHLLTYKDQSFYQKGAFMVDSTFFDVFSYHFVEGTLAQALTEPNSLVLLKPVADKLFGHEDALGKVITMTDADGNNVLTVTGVVDESLGHTHLDIDLFIRLNRQGLGADLLNNHTWAGNNFTNSYVRLRPGASAAALEKKLPAFLDRYAAEAFKEDGMVKTLHLQPVTAIHTSKGFEHEPTKTVSGAFLTLLVWIAFLILLTACINFMNLSTARAARRAREVGVRKVIGAGRKGLVLQFLGESLLLSFAGVLLALPLLVALLPYLNDITGADVHLSLVTDTRLWLILGAVGLGTGLVAGSYPAFYLSAFNSIRVLKGNFTSRISVAGIRRALVVFQFALSVVLIAALVIIYSQLQYIKHKDLGFDPNQKLIFSFHTAATMKEMPVFAQDLRGLSEVKAVSRADNILGPGPYHDWGVFLRGMNQTEAVDQQNISTDEHFVRTMGIHIVSGRDFRAGDSGKVLVNETLIKRLGLSPERAPGTLLLTSDSDKYEIAGVMKDFNYRSLKDNLAPFMLLYQPDRDDIDCIIASVSTSDYRDLLGQIEKIWRRDLPGEPFDCAFQDEAIQAQYEADITLSHILNAFTLMAILISCLGLFGLAAFSAEQRRKEISIRKALGASVTGLVGLLSMDFMKLVGIAFVIGAPLSWWATHQWLDGFAYRVTVSWWMFAIAGLLALAIALCTVCFQALKAALANPVRSLHSE